MKEVRIAGAGLHVSRNWPLQQERGLWDKPKVATTPQMASTSPREEARAATILEDKPAPFAAGEPLRDTVDPGFGY